MQIDKEKLLNHVFHGHSVNLMLYSPVMTKHLLILRFNTGALHNDAMHRALSCPCAMLLKGAALMTPWICMWRSVPGMQYLVLALL